MNDDLAKSIELLKKSSLDGLKTASELEWQAREREEQERQTQIREQREARIEAIRQNVRYWQHGVFEELEMERRSQELPGPLPPVQELTCFLPTGRYKKTTGATICQRPRTVEGQLSTLCWQCVHFDAVVGVPTSI